MDDIKINKHPDHLISMFFFGYYSLFDCPKTFFISQFPWHSSQVSPWRFPWCSARLQLSYFLGGKLPTHLDWKNPQNSHLQAPCSHSAHFTKFSPNQSQSQSRCLSAFWVLLEPHSDAPPIGSNPYWATTKARRTTWKFFRYSTFIFFFIFYIHRVVREQAQRITKILISL